MAKKWPGMVVQRSFIKGHSFRNRLQVNTKKIGKVFAAEKEENSNDATISFKSDYLRINTTAKTFSVKGTKIDKMAV